MTRTSAARRRTIWSVVGGLLAIAVVVVTWVFGGGADDGSQAARGVSAGTTAPATADIPDHVRQTLALIDAGAWPEAADAPGTRGGAVFRNNEGLLPDADAEGTRITYREWDVNPKEPGRSRDAERIVTGSDGSAWYTDDHYRSFVQIRGPDR
ncbi:guanine-specific ribonuclease N1 and T1 [Gordonia sp. HNM0687]|uniref:Guanine-specific ribonuclease N1 and T1 n=1 Tax=Gordonia mangrovi TaxID=2665643 RepID=A0A6L7GUV2_9ACTN|nr:guanine-specific ribonuclease N1 and T1 [Gordonia mangrovi]